MRKARKTRKSLIETNSTNTWTYYLLRKEADFGTIAASILEAGNLPFEEKLAEDIVTAGDVRFKLFERITKGRAPTNIVLLSDYLEAGVLDQDWQDTRSYLILADFADRLWLICVGNCHSTARALPIVENFGRVVTANACGADRINSVASKQRKRASHSRLVKRSVDHGAFRELDFDKDGINFKLGGKTEEARPAQIDDMFGVAYAAPSNVDQFLHVLLGRLLAWWDDGQMNDKQLSELEPLTEIKSEKRLEELDAKLLKAILIGDPSIGVEFPSGWGTTDLRADIVRVGHGRPSPLLNQTRFDQSRILFILRNYCDGVSLPKDICVSHPDGEVTPLINLLSWSENAPSGETPAAVLIDGKWSAVETRYFTEVEQTVERFLQDMEAKAHGLRAVLPKWNGLDAEELYLKACSDEAPAGLSVLHRKLQAFRDTKLEICDVLEVTSNDVVLLHAKSGNNLDDFVYACRQVGDAAWALQDTGFSLRMEREVSAFLGGSKFQFQTLGHNLYMGLLLLHPSGTKASANLTFRRKRALYDMILELDRNKIKPVLVVLELPPAIAEPSVRIS